MNRKSKRNSSSSRAGDTPSAASTDPVANETSGEDSSSKARKRVDARPKDKRDPAVIRAEEIRTSGQRETVEAIVVAFVLAMLFREFIAEAFVIPTGSMAPTLMGAHKDLSCDQCGQAFQVGASKERRGPNQDSTVVGGMCPNCRFVNTLDLKGDVNDGTFNGDRILVSKFAYTVSDPERWDVIVFKFPGNPKQNYIKRLVGMPGETLRVQHGDVYSQPLTPAGTPGEARESILRKPVDKLLAMQHHVYDSNRQSELLIKSGYPSRVQPWAENTSEPPNDSWAVDRSADGLTASLKATGDELHWLRYFHRWPMPDDWQAAAAGEGLDQVDPYSCRAITDFYAYDCYVNVHSSTVYEEDPTNNSGLFSSGYSGKFREDYVSGGPLNTLQGRVSFGESDRAYDGQHWVGDLILDTEVELGGDCKELLLELIESGVKYQCSIDLSNGKATLKIDDGGQLRAFSDAEGKQSMTPAAVTSARAGSAVRLQMSNCDDQLLLWVDGDLVEFDGPNTYDSLEYRPADKASPRFKAGVHPLDAAPCAVAVRGGTATVERFAVSRDMYYIATTVDSRGIFDYDIDKLGEIVGQNLNAFQAVRDIQDLLGQPESWDQLDFWKSRRSVSFDLQADQFFPMGDNSPESLDARLWANAKRVGGLPDRFRENAYRFSDAEYVPRDLLVGKALAVFWPHHWRSPLPITPNFKRMRLIR